MSRGRVGARDLGEAEVEMCSTHELIMVHKAQADIAKQMIAEINNPAVRHRPRPQRRNSEPLAFTKFSREHYNVDGKLSHSTLQFLK